MRNGFFPTLALFLLAGCADRAEREVSTASEGRQCFHAGQANGFAADDDDTAYVTVGVRDLYRLELSGTCQDIDWAQRIAIRSTGGSAWVCRGLDAELIVPGPTGPDRCLVTEVTKLSDAEAEAYRARRK